MNYNKISKIVDMARVNKEETQIFPYSSFLLTVYSNDHNPPHFHLKSLQENYELKVSLEGQILEVIDAGKRRSKDIQRFQDVAKDLKKWMDMKSKDPYAEGKTNKVWIDYAWHVVH